MSIFLHTHNLRLLNTPSSDLYKLFTASVSRRISMTFLMVFSSVYIYQTLVKTGFNSEISIIAAIAFNIILLFIKGSAVMAAEDYTRVHGFKNSMETSLLPFVVSIICFLLTDYYFYFLIPAAVFLGIHEGFYWWGFHGYFIKSGDYKHFGKELGEIGLLETVAAILAPIAGAVVVAEFGFRAIYILSLVFMFFTIYLISKGADIKQKHDTGFDEMLYLLRKKKATFLAYAGSAIQVQIYIILWPIFLFLFFDSIFDLGIVLSLAVLLAAILGVFIGDVDDRIGEKKLISIGTPVYVLSWILRAVTSTIGIYVVADAMWNVGQKMVDLPLMALSYRKAVEKYTAREILFRELSITFGASIGLAFILVLFLIYPSFDVIFLVTVLFSMLTFTPVLTGEFDDKKKR